MKSTKDWYIVEVNTSKNFKVLRGMINSVIPKGCSVFVTSYNNYSKKQRGKLGKKVFLTDYLFVLCDYEKYMPKIISNIESIGISAQVLRDAKNDPVKLGDEDLDWLRTLDALTKKIEVVDDEFSIGDRILAVDSPLKGFTGNISAITEDRIYSTIQLKDKTYNISFRREDIIKDED